LLSLLGIFNKKLGDFMKAGNNPLSRKTEIVVQDFHNEVLIYDLTKNKAYCLNETSSMVWLECDGKKSVNEISQALTKKLKSNVSEDIVWLALKQFKKDNLLANDGLVTPLDGLNRREIVKRIGFASMIALPLIASVIAPTANHAQSGNPETCDSSLGPGTFSFLIGAVCVSSLDCCSGICMTNADESMTCGPTTSIPNTAAAVCCPNFTCDCNSRANVFARPPDCPCISSLDCCSGICMTNQDESMTCAPPSSIPFTSSAPCCF
jgi:hypothetical protein